MQAFFSCQNNLSKFEFVFVTKMLPARCLEFRVFLIVFVNPTIPYVILIFPSQENLSQLTEDSVKEFSPSPLPSHQTSMLMTNKTDIFDDQGEEDENEDGPDSAKKAKKSVK